VSPRARPRVGDSGVC